MHTFLIFIDSLHGRRICRAFWDYYKVTGVIDDSCYKINALLPASEMEGPGEAEFSMLRLKDIERQSLWMTKFSMQYIHSVAKV